MKKSAFISDVIFAFIAVFLPAVCLCRYYRLPLSVSVLLASLTGLASSVLIYLFLHRKREKLCLKKHDEEERDKLLLHLALLEKAELANYFFDFFKNREIKISPETSRPPLEFSLCENAGLPSVATQTEEYYFSFTLCPTSADSLIPIFRQSPRQTQKQKILYCDRLTEEAQKLCSRFHIRTLTGNEVYLALKKEAFLPERYLGEEILPSAKKRKLRLWFAKSNSRRFLTGGTLILITSLITPFPLYYLIFGSALIASAVFVRIFGYR